MSVLQTPINVERQHLLQLGSSTLLERRDSRWVDTFPSYATASRKQWQTESEPTISKSTTQPPRNLSCVAYENRRAARLRTQDRERVVVWHAQNQQAKPAKRAHARRRISKSVPHVKEHHSASGKHAPIFTLASDHRYVVHEVISQSFQGVKIGRTFVERKGGTDFLARSMQICLGNLGWRPEP